MHRLTAVKRARSHAPFQRYSYRIINSLPQAHRFLTRLDPVSMVRAALGRRNGRDLPERSRVSKAWPTTRAKRVIANNRRPTRLRSPRGSSVSANGSATSIPTVPPKVARVNVRPPIRRRSPAVFGCRPSSLPAVLVGAAIGWLIDRGLGISPWGMIVFLLLGFAAGVLNVMRAAGVVPTNTLDPPGSKQ